VGNSTHKERRGATWVDWGKTIDQQSAIRLAKDFLVPGRGPGRQRDEKKGGERRVRKGSRPVCENKDGTTGLKRDNRGGGAPIRQQMNSRK